jgi:hypothetical protein
MIRSLLPSRYQDGIVRQAAAPDGSPSAPIVAGRWDAATTALSRALRPVANDANTVAFFRYSSVSAVGGREAGTRSNTVVGPGTDSA